MMESLVTILHQWGLPGPHLLLAAMLAVALAAAMQLATGMGFGMLAAPFLVLIDPLFAPVPILIMGLGIAAAGALRERGRIIGTELVGGLTGRVVGMLVALAILSALPDRDTFRLIFGLLTLLAVILTASGWQVGFNFGNIFGLSVVSGVMGTITSVGAPPMALLYRQQDPAKTRPTLSAFFGFSCVIALSGLSMIGRVHQGHFIAALALLPAMLAGMVLSKYLRTDNRQLMSRVLLGLTAFSAVLLIGTALV